MEYQFDSLVFKVMLELVGSFMSNGAVIRKQASVERNGLKFGGYLFKHSYF